MTIKQFLSRHVEGYLFKDIRTMMRIRLRKGQKIGGVAYPPLTSILAGMELLGGLLQKNTFVPRGASTTYFNNYWDNFFIIPNPKYKNYRDAFWQLIRNGIAHTYLTKTGVWVVRDKPRDHLNVFKDVTNYYLIIDVVEFFNDFVSSYTNYVRPIVYGGILTTLASKVDMQQRLNEMIASYEAQSNSTLSNIFGAGTPSIPTNFWISLSGASTSPSGTIVTYSGIKNQKP